MPPLCCSWLPIGHCFLYWEQGFSTRDHSRQPKRLQQFVCMLVLILIHANILAYINRCECTGRHTFFLLLFVFFLFACWFSLFFMCVRICVCVCVCVCAHVCVCVCVCACVCACMHVSDLRSISKWRKQNDKLLITRDWPA